MNTVQTLIPVTISRHFSRSWSSPLISVLLGVALLSGLAQIAVPLPMTPVPMTGQTFGVLLISLLWGRKWGSVTVGSYLGLGACGLPVFSHGASGMGWGPTVGYLLGMLVASLLVGEARDRGWIKSFGTAWAFSLLGMVLIYGCGVAVLSYFIPHSALIGAGVLPFILGDLIKSAGAALIATRKCCR